MRVRFWGVRGASTATDLDCLGVGGNTACVEVRDAQGSLLVLDAGTGLYWLGRNLLTGPHGRGTGEICLLLSHTHWDHIQGFPFFVPAFIAGNRIRIWGGGAEHIESILEGQMSPTYSPLVSLSNLGATVEIGHLAEGQALTFGQLQITQALLHNGRHRTVGYRISEGQRSLGYVAEADHPEDGTVSPEILALTRGVDVLIHEAYHTNEEHAAGGTSLAGPSAPRASGHSSFAQATNAALAAGVGRLYYFYHHPDHTDAQVEAAAAAERQRLSTLESNLLVETAREGVELEV